MLRMRAITLIVPACSRAEARSTAIDTKGGILQGKA